MRITTCKTDGFLSFTKNLKKSLVFLDPIMSILFSGDFHASSSGEISSITKRTLLKRYREEKYSRINYHIILGDGCFLWPGNYLHDLLNYRTLAIREFPVLCVIGNHEPILGMTNISEVDIGIGEKVYQIYDNPFVAYLKRGKVYYIDGFKMLVLGGALSVDKEFQIKNNTWWKKEYWTEQEEKDVFKLLETENEFDCVLSHTGPEQINKKIFALTNYFPMEVKDEVAILNDEIHKRIKFKEWWCGHLHRNQYYFDDEEKRGYQYLYKSTKILEKVGTEMVVHNEFGMSKR
jgi:hypothetical protein